jgi:hypothetical protein
MATQALPSQRFIRKTELGPNEYRKRFRQIDDEVIAAITSPEADRVTPLMSKIYMRLTNAPDSFWERQGVLRIEAKVGEGKRLTAWAVLCELLNVSSATANKALNWMHKEGIIGYFAGKNGVGLRIFLNRAVSSIGIRSVSDCKKILDFSRTSTGKTHTSQNEAAFKGSFAGRENSDIDLVPHAPKNGAAGINTSRQHSDQRPDHIHRAQPTSSSIAENHTASAFVSTAFVERIAQEIIPKVKAATASEQERTRDWFIKHALPKAIRVAQASAYDVLRAHGVIECSKSRAVGSGGGRNRPDNRKVGKHIPEEVAPRLLSDVELSELAEGCLTLLVVQGQAIEHTLSEMSVEAGGFLLPEDAPKVRAKAELLARAGAIMEKNGREGNG